MAFADLPLDLWLEVVRHVHDRDDLRKLRLTTKALNRGATPLLFDTVYLRPNIISWQRLRRVLISPQLYKYTKELQLCNEIIDFDEEEGFRETVEASHLDDPEGQAYVLQNADTYYDRCLAITQAQQQFTNIGRRWKSILVQAAQLAPAFQPVRLTLAVVFEHSSSLKQYCGICSTCNDSSGTATDFTLEDLCELNEAFTPTSLSIDDKNFANSFLNVDTKSIFRDWKQLKTLSIQFFFAREEGLGMAVDDGHSTLRNFDTMLFCLPNLTSLSVGTFYSGNDQRFFAKRHVFRKLLRHRWHDLNKLELDGLVVSEKELVAVVSRHRTTLKSIILRNMYLVSHNDDRESCHIRTLWSIKQLTSLDHFEIIGSIVDRTTGHAVGLTPNPYDPRPGDAYGDLCRYMVGRGDFIYPQELHTDLRLHRNFISTTEFAGPMRELPKTIWEDDLMLADSAIGDTNIDNPRQDYPARVIDEPAGLFEGGLAADRRRDIFWRFSDDTLVAANYGCP